MNGVSAPLAGYEIVTDIGGGRWFGLVKQEDDEELLLEPAFEMAPRQYVSMQVQGGLTAVALTMPNVFPVMDRPSSPAVLLKWASRVRVDAFSAEDQNVFASMMKQSEMATRAARAGLAL